MIKTILITNDAVLAKEAQEAGITRIMIDLEIHGKKKRQASRTTFITTHRKEDIAAIRSVLIASQLIVRINPWHAGSTHEIDYAVAAGADLIMLPMITDLAQVDAFLDCLQGGAEPLPLIETSYSMEYLAAIAAQPEIHELYIGLNDLHLSLGLDFLFEPLALGLLDQMAETIKAHKKPFGFGGIAAIGGAGELSPERILGEHVRLGSTCVILSSRFAKDVDLSQPAGRLKRIEGALQQLHEAYVRLSDRCAQKTQQDCEDMREIVHSLAQHLRKSE